MVFFLAGLLGGILRGAVGISKYIRSYKDVKIRPLYFGLSILVSGLAGLLSAWIIKDLGMTFLELSYVPASIAIIVGYAGGDFLENMFKIITKKPEFFETKSREEGARILKEE